MKPSALFYLLLVSVMLPQTSQGQRIASSPAFALFRPAPTPTPPRPASFIPRAPDYRWEGLAIGGIAGGLLLGIAARGLCDGGSSCISPTVLGAVVGGTAGGLFGCFVGMFIPKRR
jgi:hypothetical protein